MADPDFTKIFIKKEQELRREVENEWLGPVKKEDLVLQTLKRVQKLQRRKRKND